MKARDGWTLHLPQKHYLLVRAPTEDKPSGSRHRLWTLSSTLKGHIWSHSLLIFLPHQSDWIHTQNRQAPKQLECPNPLINIDETAINKEILPGLAPPCRETGSQKPYMTHRIQNLLRPLHYSTGVIYFFYGFHHSCNGLKIRRKRR